MTEAEWLAATDWHRLRRRIKPRKAIPRKSRLFAVACCRRVAHLFADARSDEALVVCEQLADGLVTRERVDEVMLAARAAIMPAGYDGWPTQARDAAWRLLIRDVAWEASETCLTALPGKAAELAAQTALFRDVFGNPFRPVKRKEMWRTDTVLTLAHQMYDSRNFGAMPILADALQDAGCDSDDVLSHCRGDGPHVRGCWVVDLVLGRE
jgi:hypothetical protein